jgi:hypothetical protein
MSLLSRFKRNQPKSDPITIVSGLPRSGTSMMMQILQAGGLQILTDNLRAADDDNPKGYYEYERVKKLPDGDTAWVMDSRGKAVKVISALLEHLPTGFDYKIIFMRREMDEVLASQKQMLIRRDEPTDKASDETMSEMFDKHLLDIKAWLAQQPNMQVLYIKYDQLLVDPDPHIQAIAEFLSADLDVGAMLAVPDKNLYRQKNLSQDDT